MGFFESVQSGFNKYATFSGRAARSEYWCWWLFQTLVNLVADFLDDAIFHVTYLDIGPVGWVAMLGLLLPGIAVGIRRLHDIDRSGWWCLVAFTIIGIVLLLIWDCIKGTTGPNRFGPDPLAAS